MAHVDAPLTGAGTVAVVGGGWAGCAAAATLASAGRRVVLHEAAAELGGRARRVRLTLAGRPRVVDNGQHLMIGAYEATARLLAGVGVPLAAVVDRRPFALRYPDGFRLVASRLPAPWHLATALAGARGLRWSERAALTRFMRRMRAGGWAAGDDESAAAWLARHRQPAGLVDRLWRPLAIAALNTDLPDASARLYAAVLRDSLGAGSAASQLWIPRTDLSALLPDAVERHVVAHGGAVRRGSRVTAIERAADGYALAVRDGARTAVERCDAVVYAAPPAQLRALTATLQQPLAATVALTEAFEYAPISTVYLQYSADTSIRHGFVALQDRPERHRYGQWAFDRGAFDAAQRGLVAVVVSARGPHQALTPDALCEAVAAQLRDELGLPAPLDARAIGEKRATLLAHPGLRRPPNATPVPGLWLAGDWTDCDYPSTLEAAVRSGIAAARGVLA